MSGVEVIGVLASVIQITQFGISITSTIAEIYGTVQAAPARVQHGLEQLHRLLDTATIIEQNCVIQTESVQAHLSAIITYAETLQVMLGKLAMSSMKSLKRYLKVCLGNQEERLIIEQFDKLEKEKTSLILSILEVHSSCSNATLDTVRPMANKVDSIYEDTRRLTEALQRIGLDNQAAIRVNLPKRRLVEDCGDSAAGERLPVSQTLAGEFDPSNSTTPEFEWPRPPPRVGNYYKNNEARDEARQLNGDVDNADHCLPARTNCYEGQLATERSLQLNGSISSAAFIASAFWK